MAPPARNNGDLISGGVLAALGVFVVIEARHWDYLSPEGPGPGFFPIWYGIALIALSLALIAGSLKKRAASGQPVKWNELGRALFAWAALTACLALIKVLGFAVTLALLTLFIVCVIYRRPLFHGIAAGVLTSAGFYLVFPLALNVELPRGVLGF